MSLDFLYLVSNILAIPVFLALYIALRSTDESLSLIALVLGLMGLVLLVPALPIVEMIDLSNQFTTATTAIQQSQILAASKATLAQFHGSAFYAHYILGSLSLLLSSLIMLRSDLFSRGTAYLGIVTNIVVFGFFLPVTGIISRSFRLSATSSGGFFFAAVSTVSAIKKHEAMPHHALKLHPPTMIPKVTFKEPTVFQQLSNTTATDCTETQWRNLCRMGGIASLL